MISIILRNTCHKFQMMQRLGNTERALSRELGACLINWSQVMAMQLPRWNPRIKSSIGAYATVQTETEDFIHGRSVRIAHTPADILAVIDKTPSLIALAHGDGVMLKPNVVFANGAVGV